MRKEIVVETGIEDIEKTITSIRSAYVDAYSAYWTVCHEYRDSETEYRLTVSDAEREARPLTPDEIALGNKVSELKGIERERDEGLTQAAKDRLNLTAILARQIIAEAWSNLSPLERRVLDVAAAERLRLYLGHDGSKRDLVAENIIEGVARGERVNETDFLQARLGGELNCGGGLRLYHIMSEAKGIYGGEVVERIEDLGVGIFALQRTLAQLSPVILPLLLDQIPEKNLVNRRQVASYFDKVLAYSRAKFIDHDGVELTLNPHVEKTYTDKEWEEGLEQQLKAAPLIARKIVDTCPGVLTVTVFGSLTRKAQNYVMFHPGEGLRLGAFFNREEAVDQAICIAQREAEKHGVRVKTGTSHGGVFGGSFSGWHFCNEGELDELDRKLTGRPIDSIFSSLDLDRLGEITSQVLMAKPLAVSDERKFKRVLGKIKDLARRHLKPVFSRVGQIQKHMERGYPFPLEYKSGSGSFRLQQGISNLVSLKQRFLSS